MGFQLNKADVDRHLKELGYRNISEEQLDEFVKDLKKLIRYEEKQSRLKGLIQIRQNEARRKKEREKKKDLSPERSSSVSSGHFSSSEIEEEQHRRQRQRQQHRQQGQQQQRQHRRRRSLS